MILFFVTYKIKSNNTQIIIISKQVTPNMYNKYHSIFGNSIIFISDIKLEKRGAVEKSMLSKHVFLMWNIEKVYFHTIKKISDSSARKCRKGNNDPNPLIISIAILYMYYG